MKGRKTWERGYAAGLIDGEGCISLNKIKPRNHKKTPEYRLQVLINMVDKEALDFMVGCFGGAIYTHQPIERQLVYRWEICGHKSIKFLKQIIPFLRIKKKQAELAIRFRYEKERNMKKFGKIVKPNHVLESYEWYFQELKKMKYPRAAATTNRIDPEMGSDSLNLREKETVRLT